MLRPSTVVAGLFLSSIFGGTLSLVNLNSSLLRCLPELLSSLLTVSLVEVILSLYVDIPLHGIDSVAAELCS
jgi:hypothetical protein